LGSGDPLQWLSPSTVLGRDRAHSQWLQ